MLAVRAGTEASKSSLYKKKMLKPVLVVPIKGEAGTIKMCGHFTCKSRGLMLFGEECVALVYFMHVLLQNFPSCSSEQHVLQSC